MKKVGAGAWSRNTRLCIISVLCLVGFSAYSAADEQVISSGEQLYEETCAACHAGQVAKAPHKDMISLMSTGSIVETLTSGAMQRQASHLSNQEILDVAEFITGHTLAEDSSYQPKFCQNTDDWFDYSEHPNASGWGIDRKNTRFAPSSGTNITSDNIHELKIKWIFPFPGAIRIRSQPILLGGALYTGSADGTVYALDAQTACIRWTFKAGVEVRSGIVSTDWQGDETGEPTLFFGDLTGTLYAVDAVTGSLKWSQKPSSHPSVTITASPLYYDNTVYLALSSLEVTSAADPAYECCSFRGALVAFDSNTGEQKWMTETITEPLIATGENSKGTIQYGPSGSPIWSNLALDVKRNRIYAGTGENYSSPANGTSDAILAFDLTTGEHLWTNQRTKNDAWNMGCEMEDRSSCPKEDGPDFDFGAAIMLGTLSDGRDVIFAGQKSGVVHALDPENNGKLLWQRRVGKGGIQGGIHFGMARDGDVLYAPISDFPDRHEWPWKWEEHPGMVAINAQNGDILWRSLHKDVCEGREFCTPGISAAATATKGMVLAGAMDGWLRAYDKTTGEVIWKFNAARDFSEETGTPAYGGSFGGSVGPVLYKDMMFIQSGYGLYFHMPGNVMIAFKREK